MKKFIYITLVLALGGAAVSGLLLFQHHFPEANAGFFTCGDGLTNPCAAVSGSKFGSIFGIPLAAWGLYTYLAILFLVLIADYAGKVYEGYIRSVIFLLAGLSLAGDLVLGGLMASMGQFCSLCFTTYVINALLLVVAVVWVRADEKPAVQAVINPLRDYLSPSEDAPHHRAALSTIFIALFFLGFSVFATHSILATKNGKQQIPEKEILAFVRDFTKQVDEKPALPPSQLVLGDPQGKVTIVAFTDFLCSACYELFKVEKHLLTRFPRGVKIIYYHYPLDSACNPYVQRDVYPGSCYASMAMEAAQEKGILTKYIVNHFRNYKSIKRGYTRATALSVLDNTPLEKDFSQAASSGKTSATLQQHIEAASRLNIRATPTLFINGRRLEGVPPASMMEALVDKLLSQ